MKYCNFSHTLLFRESDYTVPVLILGILRATKCVALF